MPIKYQLPPKLPGPKLVSVVPPKWVKINRRKEERKKKKEESMSNNDWEVRVPPNLITLPGNLMTVINNQEKSESFRALYYILQCYMHNFKITLRGDESLISRVQCQGGKKSFFSCEATL